MTDFVPVSERHAKMQHHFADAGSEFSRRIGIESGNFVDRASHLLTRMLNFAFDTTYPDFQVRLNRRVEHALFSLLGRSQH